MITLRRSQSIDLDALLPPQERAVMFAGLARQERDALIAAGKAAPVYETYVDGRKSGHEESVRPGGTIVYHFSSIGTAALFALEFARERSPSRSGRYKRGWFIVVNGRPWQGDPLRIPPFAQVYVTNAAPYHRAIDTGSQKTVGVQIVEATRQAVRRAFPDLDAYRVFLNLSGGTVAGFATPYILRRGSRVAKAKQDVRSSAFRAGRLFLSRRSDRRAGAEVSYPAIQIKPRLGAP